MPDGIGQLVWRDRSVFVVVKTLGFIALDTGKLTLDDLAVLIAVKTIEVLDDELIQLPALLLSEKIDRGFDWQNRLSTFSFG